MTCGRWVFVEVMLSSVLVLGPDAAGTPEMHCGLETGRPIPPNDATVNSDWLKELLNDNVLRGQIIQ